MRPKDRVHAALRKQLTDRIPVFMWLHPDTSRRLARLLEIPEGCLHEVLGNDVRQTWVNNNYAMEGIIHQEDGDSHTDFWGIGWRKSGPYNQPVGFPLAAAGRDEILAYRFPVEKIDFLLDRMKPVLHEGDRYFLGCDVSPCVFEMYWRLRSLQQTFVDIAVNQDLARTMFSRCAEFALALTQRACSEMALDWLWTGDDVAGQTAMVIDPALWRDTVKPLLAEIFRVARRHNLWVAFHCCGAVRPIIPDLVEIGMDVLNPIQHSCSGMDPAELKREFGSAISFMGGVDTQDLLPNGTVAEVRNAARRLIDTMTSDGGGYILAASHTIPPETPDENIFALYEEAGITREEIFDRAASVRHN